MIERIPDDILTGGDAVLGNSALATAGAVPFVASPGVLTEDQYFKYTAVPGSPLAGNTFNRLNFTDASPPTGSIYDTNAGYDVSIRRTYTARPFTASGSPTNMGSVYVRGVYNLNTAIGVAGSINASTQTAAASANTVGNLYGVAGNVDNKGTGAVDEVDGLYFTAFNWNAGNIGIARGIYAANATFGAGNVTTLRGVDTEATAYGTGSVTLSQGIRAFSGNWGTTGAGAITTHASIDNKTQTDGPITTCYALRNTRGGSVDPTTAWGLSEETGWNNRLLGKTAIGPSNSTAPTNTLYVKDATATTGATSVVVAIGAGQTNTSTVCTLEGVLKYSGENTTGAGSALLGANCPAVTVAAPYTWFRMVSSDGATVYLPAWK